MPSIIGITTSQASNRDNQPISLLTQAYINAMLQAGGLPVLIPSMLAYSEWETLYHHLDGILFSGGGDIAVERFASGKDARIQDVDPARDELEIGLLRKAVIERKPILGICRGCQLLNVGLGGTLYTHIIDQMPGALQHDYPGNLRDKLVHDVEIDEASQVGEILGQEVIKVNSHHHQGLKDIAKGLRVAGHSPDSLVEAIEMPDHPFAVGVQWHPEWLTNQEPARRLFAGFVEAAAK